MKTISKVLFKYLCIYILVIFTQNLYAGDNQKLTPSTLFNNEMVLQRNMPVPVWGKAKAGDKVTVSFAGQEKSAKAGKDGKWMVKLAPMKASSEGRKMTISTKEETLTFSGVMVGEVWLCSGQSNMQFQIQKVAELAKLKDEPSVKKNLRVFQVTPDIALEPKENGQGEWALPSIKNSAVAFGFGYYLQKKLNIPVGVVVACLGSSHIESWMPIEMTEQLPHFKQIMEEFNEKDRSRVENIINESKDLDPRASRKVMFSKENNVFLRTRPNILYNAMMAPLVPYAIKGVVWYQGESNTKRYKTQEDYAKSLPLWVKKLRSLWSKDDLHFLAVQLPGFGKMSKIHKEKGIEHPNTFCWARFREIQSQVLKLPYTGVSNSIDLGEVKNIHPSDKEPICKRLSLIAMRDVYNSKASLGQGPSFSKYEVKKDKVIIEFDYADGLKTKDGEAPKGFWLSGGENQEWHQATATIKGNKVIVSSDKVKKPVACRYAFSAKPTVNLVNKEDLPAYPFRTDNYQTPKK